MKELIIYGASNVDMVVVVDNINKHGEETVRILGFLDDEKYKEHNGFMGYPILGGCEKIEEYRDKYYFVNNVFRTFLERDYVLRMLKGCEMYSVIDPSTNLNYVTLGNNVYIGVRVFLGALVNIKDNVSIKGYSYIGHETVLEENVYIAPCSCILGRVKIGRNSRIGGNVTIRDNIVIGDNVVVGCGTVVVKDVPSNTIVVGNPAKPIWGKSNIF